MDIIRLGDGAAALLHDCYKIVEDLALGAYPHPGPNLIVVIELLTFGDAAATR